MQTLVKQFCWTIAFAITFATPSYAELVNITPVFNATLQDQDLDGIFETGSNANNVNEVRRTDGVVNEAYYFEFDVSGVDANLPVTSASLSFTVFEAPSSPGDIAILAYEADGVADFTEDGVLPAVLIGSYDPISLGSGTVSVMLDATIVNDFATTGDFVGIRMQGFETDASTTIRGIETTLIGIPPTLSLDTTAVPEPSALVLLLAATIPAVLRSGRNRRITSTCL